MVFFYISWDIWILFYKIGCVCVTFRCFSGVSYIILVKSLCQIKHHKSNQCEETCLKKVHSVTSAASKSIMCQSVYPESKVHGTNMGPTWILSARDGPHIGPMNLAISTVAGYSQALLYIMADLHNDANLSYRVTHRSHNLTSNMGWFLEAINEKDSCYCCSYLILSVLV